MSASIIVDDSHLYEDITEAEAIEIMRASAAGSSSSSESNVESNRIREVFDDDDNDDNDVDNSSLNKPLSKSERHSSSRDIAISFTDNHSSNTNNNNKNTLRNTTTNSNNNSISNNWRRGTLFIRRKIDSILRMGDLVMDVMKGAGKLFWIGSTTLLLMGMPILYAYDREKSALGGGDQLMQ